MDATAAAAGITAAEEYLVPPARYFLSDQLAVTVRNEISHEPLPYTSPLKDRPATGDSVAAVPPMWPSHLRTAGTAPYSSVDGESVLIPAIDKDQPTVKVYSPMCYERRPTSQMYGSWPHPPLQLHNQFLKRRPNGTATGTIYSSAEPQAHDQPAFPLSRPAASSDPGVSNQDEDDGPCDLQHALAPAGSSSRGSGDTLSADRGLRKGR